MRAILFFDVLAGAKRLLLTAAGSRYTTCAQGIPCCRRPTRRPQAAVASFSSATTKNENTENVLVLFCITCGNGYYVVVGSLKAIWIGSWLART